MVAGPENPVMGYGLVAWWRRVLGWRALGGAWLAASGVASGCPVAGANRPASVRNVVTCPRGKSEPRGSEPDPKRGRSLGSVGGTGDTHGLVQRPTRVTARRLAGIEVARLPCVP